jgi:hypothetical protein
VAFLTGDYNNKNKGLLMTSITDRFLAAVHCCSSSESVKTRLAQAWLEYLDPIDTRELPEEIRKDFIGLRSAMYDRKPLSFENAPLASVRKMSTAEAAAHIKAIVTLYTELLQIKAAPLVTREAQTKARNKSNRSTRIQAQLN